MIKVAYPIKVDWDNYKFRCSSLGKLLPGPRGKLGELQQTQKTELEKIYLKEVWGFEKEFTSKQTDKGNKVETEAIGIVNNKYYKGYPHLKNTTRDENDFVIGTWDLLPSGGDMVHDIKSSYDLDTFMRAELTKDNLHQIKGYQWILGLKKGQVDKVLVSHPEDQAERERNSLIFKVGGPNGPDEIDVFDPEYIRQQELLELRINYDRIPEGLRIKSFRADIDDAWIDWASEHLTVLRKELKKISL